LHAAATAMVERHDGMVPSDHDELLALPGIGHYTAAAVASFAYGGRHAVLDTNVRRLLARLVEGLAQPAATSVNRAETALADRQLPDEPARAARWAAATMELGALVCTARAPRCTACPVSGQCAWLQAGAPPATGPARASQRYEGTDRWVRGRLLAVARDATGPVTHAALRRAVPDDVQRDPGQRERALDSLVVDGLLEPVPRNRFRLPGR
jgi:A/G-specific adenine glycosylase